MKCGSTPLPGELQMMSERIWDDLPMSRLCHICGLCDGEPASWCMTRQPGVLVCSECFRIWYDCNVTDPDEIKAIRIQQQVKEVIYGDASDTIATG